MFRDVPSCVRTSQPRRMPPPARKNTPATSRNPPHVSLPLRDQPERRFRQPLSKVRVIGAELEELGVVLHDPQQGRCGCKVIFLQSLRVSPTALPMYLSSHVLPLD